MKQRSRSPGFTIVELLIVIVVIGILAAITIVAFGNIQQRARDTRRLSDIQQSVKKLQLYYAENGSFPSTGGLSTAYTDSNCLNANPNKRSDWIPGISGLPQSFGPRPASLGCYNYASDGTQYVMSAWGGVEGGPLTQAASSLYRRLGFRESSFSSADGYNCNTNAGNNTYWDPLYKYSYTATNITTCAEIGW